MRVTAAHVAALAAAALAPAAAWAAAAAAGGPGSGDEECRGSEPAISKDDVAGKIAYDIPAGRFGVELFQTHVAMPKEENRIVFYPVAKDMVLIVNTTANTKRGQFLDRVKKRMEGCNFTGNLTVALARQQQIPSIDDILGGVTEVVDTVTGTVVDTVTGVVDSVTGAVTGAVGSVLNTTFITIAVAINTTLNALQEKAVDLLDTCLVFRDSLLQSIQTSSSSAWDALSSRLTGFIGTFMTYWVPTLEALQLAVPILTETLSGFGFANVAVPFNQTMTSVLQIADQITAQLSNTSAVVTQVAAAQNTSTALLDAALGQIENVTNYAVAQATEFGAQLQDSLMALILDLARQVTGVNISAAEVSQASPGSVEGIIAELAGQVDNITQTLTTALDTVFTGINEAAALATVQDAGGAAARGTGFLLPLLLLLSGLAMLLPPSAA